MPRNLENYREWKRKKYLENRDKEIDRKRKYRQTQKGKVALQNYYQKMKHTDKYKARVKISTAIRGGKIEKGKCEICSSMYTQAHHEDYSKPFEVRWFCKKHHSEIHHK